MGRKRGRKWFSRIVGVIASLAALCVARNNVEASEEHTKSCPPPGRESVREKILMVVSTLDGRVSALDVGDQGQMMWSVQADSRPLLSSSISKMELTRDGVRTRLIPSLDGGLYQYDGESIEAVPMTAETLLSSSLRLSDNTMMIGGKDIRTYGVDPSTGEVRYLCTMAGCQDVGEDNVKVDQDLIVISRNTQTVRAVDARVGAEKWNFSVGQHEVEILDSRKPNRLEDNDDDDDDDDDDVTILPCPSTDEEVSDQEIQSFEESLKIIVPDGMIVALNPDDPTLVKWQHKFPSAVANAWLLRDGQLKRLSLFDTRHVPSISSFQPEHLDGQNAEPLLYVGLHQHQLYVQPSHQMQESVSAAVAAAGGNNVMAVPPRVTWRPYLSSAPSRTPLLNTQHHIEQGGDSDTSLTVWHENYPFDNGYYLYPDVTPRHALQDTPNRSRENEDTGGVMDMVLPATLWNWWKEVIAISLVTSFVVHILLTRYMHRHLEISQQTSLPSSDSVNSLRESDSAGNLMGDAQKQQDYMSRFSQDFECMHCLGKGGFGVVFEAKNKVDDCHYAVKRICIPNRETQKARVTREVKALAKLDHVGIVRFYHAWLETPPAGWQEEHDRQFDDSECLSPTPCNTGTDLSSLSRFPPNQAQEASLNDPLARKLGALIGDSYSSPISHLNHLREGTSQEFSAHSNMDASTDESGSFSFAGGDADRMECAEDSFSIEFRNSQSSSVDQTNSCDIPFKSYLESAPGGASPGEDRDSFSIVFEDSGCTKGSNSDVSRPGENTGRTDSNVVFTLHSNPDKESQSKSNNVNKAFMKNGAHPSQVSSSSSCQQPTPKAYLYIQMQLCRRETLKDWLCANTLTRDRTALLDVFDQIVSAVEYVHECGMMHRDLKPSNIFFSVDGTIKIGDFGLVTAQMENQDEVGEAGDAFAKHTAEVGTQLYMSPEQIAKKHYDHKVDIFSLGMILFELLYPFSTQMERIRTLLDAKMQKFPDRFRREMPNEHTFVSWLLSPKPSERPSAKNILESELLKDFAPRRPLNRFRSRTISSSSGNSQGT